MRQYISYSLDFKEVHDSIRREVLLHSILFEFGIP
jgi:hypothetical protein